jgi:hypothetical protein
MALTLALLSLLRGEANLIRARPGAELKALNRVCAEAGLGSDCLFTFPSLRKVLLVCACELLGRNGSARFIAEDCGDKAPNIRFGGLTIRLEQIRLDHIGKNLASNCGPERLRANTASLICLIGLDGAAVETRRLSLLHPKGARGIGSLLAGGLKLKRLHFIGEALSLGIERSGLEAGLVELKPNLVTRRVGWRLSRRKARRGWCAINRACVFLPRSSH